MLGEKVARIWVITYFFFATFFASFFAGFLATSLTSGISICAEFVFKICQHIFWRFLETLSGKGWKS
jgi:hypothetical protein